MSRHVSSNPIFSCLTPLINNTDPPPGIKSVLRIRKSDESLHWWQYCAHILTSSGQTWTSTDGLFCILPTQSFIYTNVKLLQEVTQLGPVEEKDSGHNTEKLLKRWEEDLQNGYSKCDCIESIWNTHSLFLRNKHKEIQYRIPDDDEFMDIWWPLMEHLTRDLNYIIQSGKDTLQ